MRQIVLDTETTGLEIADNHRIIEIAAVELVDRRVTGNFYHQYICPQRSIDLAALAVHGITEDFLADKPIFPAVAKEFLAFIKDAELIIHNAPFDVGFLNRELELFDSQLGTIAVYCTVLDTLAMARKKHPGQHNSLDALCRRYKIDNSARDLHGALLDAHLLAKVYLAMTGGQTTLFDIGINAQDMSGTTTLMTFDAERVALPLKVLRANEEELQMHNLRLQTMKQANGGFCVWEE